MNRKTALATLERELVRARALAHAPAHAPARDLDCALARAFVRDLGRDLHRDLIRALVRALRLVRALGLACDLDLARALALARACDGGLAHDIACDLACRIDSVLEYVRELDQHSAATAGGQLMPGRVSRGLLALAVQLLPAAQRHRYDAEFHGELGELGRRKRWGYAVRVLVCAWESRRALVESVPTRDGDVARRVEG